MLTPEVKASNGRIYEILKPISAGTYGETFSVRERRTGQEFVLKLIFRPFCDQK